MLSRVHEYRVELVVLFVDGTLFEVVRRCLPYDRDADTVLV